MQQFGFGMLGDPKSNKSGEVSQFLAVHSVLYGTPVVVHIQTGDHSELVFERYERCPHAVLLDSLSNRQKTAEKARRLRLDSYCSFCRSRRNSAVISLED